MLKNLTVSAQKLNEFRQSYFVVKQKTIVNSFTTISLMKMAGDPESDGLVRPRA